MTTIVDQLSAQLSARAAAETVEQQHLEAAAQTVRQPDQANMVKDTIAAHATLASDTEKLRTAVTSVADEMRADMARLVALGAKIVGA